MDPGVMFGVLLVAIIAIAIVARALRKSYEKLLRELARSVGLTYERLGAPIGAGHAVRGYLDGRPFELLVMPEGRRASTRILGERWTIYLAGALPPGFAAGRNGWRRRASPGVVRVTTGNAEFDSTVFVEGRNPHEVAWVLGAEPRRAAIRDLATMDGLILDGKVMFHKTGFDTRLPRLQARLACLRAIARTIDPVDPIGAGR